MLVLLEFSVLRFLLFKFSVLGSSIARYGGSSFPFPLLVTVGSRSSLQTSFSNNWTLDFSPNIVSNTLPFYADDSCAPCFLQHLVPLLVVPTNFVPQKNKKTARVNTGLKKMQWPRLPLKPDTHCSRSISFTFSTSCLCLSSNSFAASFYEQRGENSFFTCIYKM